MAQRDARIVSTLAQRDALLAMEAPIATTESIERTLFRPSRTCYPGSKFGPKTRYDLPRRHKAYGNADEIEAILYSGTTLQPLTATALPPPSATNAVATPRQQTPTTGVLTDVARSMLHPLADRNLPELPLLDEKNDVHGILVLGGKGAGKTSLVISLLSVVTGSYPTRKDGCIEDKRHAMPTYGQCYELPERDVRLGSGTMKTMRLVLTDTPACGVNSKEEQPLCTSVSPNSVHQFNAIPSWMRITMRGGNFPHYAVVFAIDATARPLWEDNSRCRELARLLAVLKRSQYTVVVAVTKLLKARQAAVRETNYGTDHGGQVGRDPRSSYESYASRYIAKVCAAIQAKASENDWSFSQGPDAPAFPLPNVTIFDAPTWEGAGDFKKWQEVKATSELPNGKYIASQLNKILLAASVRSHPEL